MTSIANSKLLMTTYLLICSLCLVAQETDCGNGLDDDKDGFIDCADSECYGISSCETAFTCTNTLYQVISATLKKLDPLTGEYEAIGSASSSYNGAGFNVQDGYIYGIKSATGGVRLWKINNQGKETDLGIISNFYGRTYVGDFDESGNLYTYNGGSSTTLSYVDVDSETLTSTKLSLTHISTSKTPGVADITYNPVYKKFYGLSGGHELLELDHIAKTARVLGDFSEFIDVNGGFGAAWSDQNGNSYFSNNSTGKIFRFAFTEYGEVANVSYVATGQPTNSNDGMGCFFSLPPFEIDCNDNIDNDGDGLTDCEDPDCANAGICPSINMDIKSIKLAGPSSIIPFHLQLVNNSKADAIDFSIISDLPVGFTFLSDSLEYSSGASAILDNHPIEGTKDALSWERLNIPVGDTIMISYSLLVDRYISPEDYTFSFSSSGIVTTPYDLKHSIAIDEIVYYDPTSYDCEPAFYQVYKKRGEPNILGKLNPTSGTYDQIAIIDHQANGLGYDVQTGYAFGSDGNKFIRIDQDGHVTYLGLQFEKKVYVGDMDDQGNWYGKVGGDIVKVDVENPQIIETYKSQGMPGWDMAYNVDGHFYAVHGQDLYQFNTTTKSKNSLGKLIGDEVPNSGHGAQWTGIDGYHYISNNKTGRIYRINIESKTATLSMTTESNLQFNDGFACPTELPIVFEYDFGDNRAHPIARQLVYTQDKSDDNRPDYKMTWLGEEITKELLDPSNKTATGDDGDDGLVMGTNYQPNTINQASLSLNTNTPEITAHFGLWVDWDIDGTFDDFYNGSKVISSLTSVNIDIAIPADFNGQNFAIRARVSAKEVTKDQYQGDIYEPGEVEDYVLSGDSSENCTNGIDDNQDGLIDCDDPACYNECTFGATGSAGEGGLESNDNLIDKVTNTLYQRKMSRASQGLRRNNLSGLNRTNSYGAARITADGSLQLADLIPIDIIADTKTYITSPQHLINITNAVDLFSVDIYEEEKRVAAILALETNNGVYEHTKYICDRLTGSKIIDIFEYKIDGTHDFIVAKLELPDGNIEYSSSFSLSVDDQENLNLESYWNIEEYSDRDAFYNFQIWANNTNSLFKLCNETLKLITTAKNIVSYSIGNAPETFVQNGSIEDGQLTLNIVNKTGVDHLNINGNFRKTETMEVEDFNTSIQLNGSKNEEVTINIGDIYYMGLSLSHPDNTTNDAVFLANGTWGYDYNQYIESVSTYEILPTDHKNENRYDIQRSIVASGQVLDYISFYRSFAARFTQRDLTDYNSLTFTASGNAKLEIAVMKEGVEEWQYQAKTIINLTEEEREYNLGQSFFQNIEGNSTSWEDAYMIAINVIGNRSSTEAFDFKIKDVFFSHHDQEDPYLVYTDKNIVGPRTTNHIASADDGTDQGIVEIKASQRSRLIPITVENISQEPIIIDDIELVDGSNSMSVSGFEPQVVEAGSTATFNLTYHPNNTGISTDALATLYIETPSNYDEVAINIKAESTCPEIDHVKTEDLTTISNSTELKAINRISSDANITMSKLTLSAKNEITLTEGFELKAGSELNIRAEDRCSSNK